MKWHLWGGVLLALITLAGCAETSELDAVRQAPGEAKMVWQDPDKADPNIKHYAYDDRPRVIPQDDYETVKGSFIQYLNAQCGRDSNIRRTTKLPATSSITDDTTADNPTWPVRNHRSNDCALRVAAYAIDQCGHMTIRQNEAATTAQLLTGAALVGSALATDGIALASPSGDNKTAEAALAAAVTANGSGLKGFLPAVTQTKPGDMYTTAPQYAEAVGISDQTDFTPDTAGRGGPRDPGYLKFARLHDALLGMCQANAMGLRKARRN